KFWDSEQKIIVDFEDLIVASVSFIDEAFGQLAYTYSLEDMKDKLAFININQEDRKLLNYIILSRFKEKDIEEQGTDS
ncbi:DUF4325 domain-containing protein, partial [bacterium]|nr:DUF4325 domain-containing protein [bacterium]